MKKRWTLRFVLLVVVTLVSCDKSSRSVSREREGVAGTLRVSATFNALSELARAIGGEHVAVTTIVPDGMEPHDFEPKARDLVALGDANVFIYNGFNLEPWVDAAVAAAQNAQLIAVDSSVGIEPIALENPNERGSVSGYDPHVWLGLTCAEIQAANIAKAFASADPTHADEYRRNAASFIAKLDSFHAEYLEKLERLPHHAFVTGHAAFGYLCRDFGLEQNSVEDVFASGEPSAQAMALLIDFARERGVKTIFVESMVSPAVSETLAAELGAKVQTIYTLESSEDGKDYLERVRANLEAIYASLSE